MWGRRCVRVGGLLAAVIAAAPATAEEADYPCPGDLRPLRGEDAAPGFGVMSLLFPPLLLMDMASHDELSDRPRREVSVKVSGPAGLAPGPTRIAILYDGVRHLGDVEDGARTRLPGGRYVLLAARATGDGGVAWGRREVTVPAKGGARFEVSLDRSLVLGRGLRLGQLAPDGRAPAASVVTLDWDGPWQADGRVSFAPATKAAEAVGTPARIGSDRPSQVEAPSRAGRWDLRLELCAPRLPVSQRSIAVADPDVKLDAPAEVGAGQRFSVHSLGRNGLSFEIALLGPDGEEIFTRELELAEPSVEFVAPLVPGRHTLVRRTSGDGEAKVELARRTIMVEAAAIEIRAPDRVKTGAAVDLDWTGAGGATQLELWRAAEGSHPALRLRDDLGSSTGRLPAGPGRYELRVVARSGDHPVLARRSLLVEGGLLAQVPERLKPGAIWAVGLEEKPGFFDKLAFVPRGAGVDAVDRASTFDPNGSRAVEISAPETAGAYDLVVVAIDPAEASVILDRRPVDVK